MDIKKIRAFSGLTQNEFAKKYEIPIGTLHHWEAGDRKPPEYVLKLLQRVIEGEQAHKALQEAELRRIEEEQREK